MNPEPYESDPAHNPARIPAPKRGLRPLVGSLMLRLGGWRAEGDPPDLQRMVIVAAPHTSLWDGFWMLMFAWHWDLSINWFVKRSFTRGPLGWIVLATGAIPVDRSAPHGLVGELVRAFAERQTLHLSVPPEGTRARRAYWKSGFYHIARAAKVPVCLSYLDFGRRQGGFGPCFHLSGDVRADMDRVRAFYKDMRGRIPDQFTPPRLAEEDEQQGRPAPASQPEAE